MDSHFQNIDFRYRINITHAYNKPVASPNTIDETKRLYEYHLRHQVVGARLKYPLYNKTKTPQNVNSLRVLADRFADSYQRENVFQQAQGINLNDLNWLTFSMMSQNIFKEGNTPWEQVLILFYFYTDLSIIALQNMVFFMKLYNWIIFYITRRLSVWIELEGGWDVVLQTPVNHYSWNLSIIGACCVGILLICLYIRNK